MKNVLITGATGNLGKAVVKQFQSNDFYVIATVAPVDSGKNIPDASSYKADLTNEKSVDDVIRNVINDHKKIDAAVLLVGGFAPGNLEKTDAEILRKMIAMNFETAFNVAKPIFNHMAANGGGRIIMVSAKTALQPELGKNAFAYAMSKTMIVNLSQLLNAEGASKNVVCSVIAPSTIDTEVNRKAMPDADFTKWVKPEQIAEAIYFLSSEKGAALREPLLKVYGGA